MACWSIKAAISLKRVKIEEKLLWRAYRKSPTLFFRMVPPTTPYDLLFPRLRFTTPNQNYNRYYPRNGYGYTFQIFYAYSKTQGNHI